MNEGLKYLNTRIGFWRQQNPLYARKKEAKIVPRMKLKSGNGTASAGKHHPPSAHQSSAAGTPSPAVAPNHGSSAKAK